MIDYIAFASIAVLAVALAGAAISRHLVVLMLSIQLMFIASGTLLVSLLRRAQRPALTQSPCLYAYGLSPHPRS